MLLNNSALLKMYLIQGCFPFYINVFLFALSCYCVADRLGRKLEPVVSHQLFPVQVHGTQVRSVLLYSRVLFAVWM